MVTGPIPSAPAAPQARPSQNAAIPVANLRVALVLSSLALLSFGLGRRYTLVEPVRDHAGVLVAVLLEHKIVGIAVDADVGQPHEVAVDAGLLEQQRIAVIRRGVEARLGGQDHDRDALEPDQLSR